MTSYINLCMAQKCREFAALSRPRSLPEEDETFRTFCDPEDLHFLYLGFFTQVTWAQVSHETYPLQVNREILKLLILLCKWSNQTSRCTILLLHAEYITQCLTFTLTIFYDVMYGVTGVIWDYRYFQTLRKTLCLCLCPARVQASYWNIYL